MTKPAGAALASALLFACAASMAQAPEEELETVLVTGEQPGPGLWKVSRDGHVMWVLGSIGRVPATFVWRTGEIEARIAESQEVLYPGWSGVGIDIGLFQALTLLPAAFKAAKNPDGKTLKDVLTPEHYAAWLELRRKYLDDDDDIDRYRPIVVEEKLNNAIGRKAMKGIRMMFVDGVVNELANRHKVPIHSLPGVQRKIEVEKPRAILKAARNMDLAEGDCVGRNFARLRRADAAGLLVFDAESVNAWATGDLQAMRAKSAIGPDVELAREDCFTVAMNTAMNHVDADSKVNRGLDLIRQQAEMFEIVAAEVDRNWLEAAEAALAKNASTFAVVPLEKVMTTDGYLAKLAAKGYVVEEPDREPRSPNENAGASFNEEPASANSAAQELSL